MSVSLYPYPDSLEVPWTYAVPGSLLQWTWDGEGTLRLEDTSFPGRDGKGTLPFHLYHDYYRYRTFGRQVVKLDQVFSPEERAVFWEIANALMFLTTTEAGREVFSPTRDLYYHGGVMQIRDVMDAHRGESLTARQLASLTWAQEGKVPHDFPAVASPQDLIDHLYAHPPVTVADAVFYRYLPFTLMGSAPYLAYRFRGYSGAQKYFKKVEDAAFVGRLIHAVEKAEETPDALVKDIGEVDLSIIVTAKVNGAHPVYNLPMGTQGYRAYLQERTFEEVSLLTKHLQKSLDMKSAVAMSDALLQGGVPQEVKVPRGQGADYTWQTMAQDVQSLLERVERLGDETPSTTPFVIYGVPDSIEGLWTYVSANAYRLRNYHPGIFALLMEWGTTPPQEGESSYSKKTLHRVIVGLISHDDKTTCPKVPFLAGGSLDKLITSLLTTVEASTIMRYLIALDRVGERLTLRQWNALAKHAEEYKEMPFSWWHPLVAGNA